MTKLFKEMTIAEKFAVIAGVVAEVEGLENAEEMVEFLHDRADKQVKANKAERKASKDSEKLQGAVVDALMKTGRATADTVFEALEAEGYEDGHKSGLTVARVRAALSALVKEELIVKYEASRKKNAEFTKVSYAIAGEEVAEESTETAEESAE